MKLILIRMALVVKTALNTHTRKVTAVIKTSIADNNDDAMEKSLIANLSIPICGFAPV